MIVEQLWRYPVKSMGGEQVGASAIGETGLVGDRAWGLVDVATGNVLTARRAPQLLFASARLTSNGDVEIVLPDGRVTDDSQVLSAWLGAEVVLASAGDEGGVYENPRDAETETDWVSWQGPPRAWHDSPNARVSIISASSIGGTDPRRFRANVLVSGAGEDDLVGSCIDIGTATFDVRARIARCVMVSRPQPGLPRDLDVLRAIHRDRQSRIAVGAIVARPGRIEVGDEVRLSERPSGEIPA